MDLHTCIFTTYWILLVSLNSWLCISSCFYPNWEKKRVHLGFLAALYHCSSSSLHQSLWNMRSSKRQQVIHSALCFISTLIRNVASRKRAKVLEVLRWSEGEQAWLSQGFLPAISAEPCRRVWRSSSCCRPALCPIPWSKLYCRRWCEHVKHL